MSNEENKMIIDFEELLVELLKENIDTEIYTNLELQSVVKFKDITTNKLIGMGEGENPEQALASVIKKLICNNQIENTNIIPLRNSDKLSIL